MHTIAPQFAPLIGFGQVRHSRLRPTSHHFTYPNWFLLLPMRSWRDDAAASVLARNTPAALSFYDCDHGDGRSDALTWLDDLLAQEGITEADGEVWLHTYPRVWGYTFKPVSFWHCYRADGALVAIVAEVNNTFGERHCYLLPQPSYGVPSHAEKVFHVSPFCDVSGRYRFAFMRRVTDTAAPMPSHWLARVELHDGDGLLVNTSVSGALQALNPATRRRALWSYPWLSVGVMLRIHWQALQLWRKRVPFFRKPTPPTEFVTR
jgi:DUF1365 family protein